MAWATALALILAASRPPSSLPSAPSAADGAAVAAVETAVQSANLEWSERFEVDGRRYRPPRVLILRVPAGHPAHGAGYSPRFGIVINLNDVDAIEHVFGSNAQALNALLIAHEVGHHVQFLMLEDHAPGVPQPGPARERQADCYAGWWLAAANARSLSQREPGRLIPNLDVDFPRMLYVLSVAQTGRMAEQVDEATHGSLADRVTAIKRGLAAQNPAECAFRPPSAVRAP